MFQAAIKVDKNNGAAHSGVLTLTGRPLTLLLFFLNQCKLQFRFDMVSLGCLVDLGCPEAVCGVCLSGCPMFLRCPMCARKSKRLEWG